MDFIVKKGVCGVSLQLFDAYLPQAIYPTPEYDDTRLFSILDADLALTWPLRSDSVFLRSLQVFLQADTMEIMSSAISWHGSGAILTLMRVKTRSLICETAWLRSQRQELKKEARSLLWWAESKDQSILLTLFINQSYHTFLSLLEGTSRDCSYVLLVAKGQIIQGYQSKSPPISISSSSTLGSYLGLGFSAAFSAGLAAYLAAGFSAATGAGAELPPEAEPKNSVTLRPERALTTALTRVALAETLAAARTALTESTVMAAPCAERMNVAQLTASCSFQAITLYQLLKQSIIHLVLKYRQNLSKPETCWSQQKQPSKNDEFRKTVSKFQNTLSFLR